MGEHSLSNDERQRRVRERAYEIFLRRQGRLGSPEGDWLQAEKELRDRDRPAYFGAATISDARLRGSVTHPDGRDLENPTSPT
jgi:hypothetical protein